MTGIAAGLGMTLSARERELAAEIAAGAEVRALARRLEVRPARLYDELRDLYCKGRARTRQEFVARLWKEYRQWRRLNTCHMDDETSLGNLHDD